jgi:RNA polymerase sigma-70 factor, ECF subfamily
LSRTEGADKMRTLAERARRNSLAQGTHPELDPPHAEKWEPKGGDLAVASASFEDLYNEYFDFTFRSLRYLGVAPSLLPDVVQDVWLAVHRQLSQFEGRSTYRTWLFAIALNTTRNQRRRERRMHIVPLSEELPDSRSSPERAHADREVLSLVHEYLTTLDEPRRVLFVSQLLEDLSAAESAEILGIDVATVYHRVRDLRRHFKRWFAARQESGK